MVWGRAVHWSRGGRGHSMRVDCWSQWSHQSPSHCNSLFWCAAACRYQQHVNGMGPPRWLLCQASTVQQPATGAQLIMLLQLDITESQQVGWAPGHAGHTACRGGMGMHLVAPACRRLH